MLPVTSSPSQSSQVPMLSGLFYQCLALLGSGEVLINSLPTPSGQTWLFCFPGAWFQRRKIINKCLILGEAKRGQNSEMANWKKMYGRSWLMCQHYKYDLMGSLTEREDALSVIKEYNTSIILYMHNILYIRNRKLNTCCGNCLWQRR